MTSDDEVISDYEDNIVPINVPITGKSSKHEKHNCENQYGPCSWSEATKEAEALMCLNGSAKSSYKRGKGKATSKYTFHFQPDKEEVSFSAFKDEKDLSLKSQHLLENVEPISLQSEDNTMADLLENCEADDGISDSEIDFLHPGMGVFENGLIEHSMTERFDSLQNNICVQPSTSEKNHRIHRKKVKRLQPPIKKSIVLFGHRDLNDEDPHDPLICGTSSDDEISNQNIKPFVIPDKQMQTAAEQIHAILGAAGKNFDGLVFAAPKSLGSGLFARLQQVILIDKEREVDFYEPSTIDVKILSKNLDAKLTVCQCASLTDREETGGRK